MAGYPVCRAHSPPIASQPSFLRQARKKYKKKSSKSSRATRRSQSAPASTQHATAGSICITISVVFACQPERLTGNRIPATTRRDGTAAPFKHTRPHDRPALFPSATGFNSRTRGRANTNLTCASTNTHGRDLDTPFWVGGLTVPKVAREGTTIRIRSAPWIAKP